MPADWTSDADFQLEAHCRSLNASLLDPEASTAVFVKIGLVRNFEQSGVCAKHVTAHEDAQ